MTAPAGPFRAITGLMQRSSFGQIVDAASSFYGEVGLTLPLTAGKCTRHPGPKPVQAYRVESL